ncbi:hypothetical protein SRHO_G00316510 [Serrasalmus rhombeus]
MRLTARVAPLTSAVSFCRVNCLLLPRLTTHLLVLVLCPRDRTPMTFLYHSTKSPISLSLSLNCTVTLTRCLKATDHPTLPQGALHPNPIYFQHWSRNCIL